MDSARSVDEAGDGDFTAGHRCLYGEVVNELISKGHAAGDLLEAWQWQQVERRPGLLVIDAHLPDRLKNHQEQLFGGFTTTYIDLVSLYTVRTLDDEGDDESERHWMTTINLRCDYYEPILGPRFLIKGEVVNQRGLTSLVSTKFLKGDTMLAHGLTTLRTMPNVS